ncbi:universal stress protein [Flavobacterium agricola]|uniref:Universal stress protein n=1 Tax=Flavobacterium agricola TaxID=2870839 RepID=A0ABY6M0B7_9FLAO|nr:universal stress protein [Flavobacterium agricola]UYW01119.1 universal stress protein [Flavobacterium agricola]
MKKILFPTDFSETANNAFITALKMADFLNYEILVLHTYEMPVINFGGNLAFAPEIYSTIELDTFESFRDIMARLRDMAYANKLDHITINHMLLQGGLIDTMKTIVNDENVRLIVMGTSGTNDWASRLFGSNTIDVMNHVPRNLLVIPDNIQYHKISTIGFTTKFRPKDKKALKEVVRIAKKVGAEVRCLYVKPSNSDVTEETIEQWREDFKDKDVQFVIIPHDDVKESIHDFLNFNHIDVLAMLSYKSNFLKEVFVKRNLAKEIIGEIKIPLLAIRADYKE